MSGPILREASAPAARASEPRPPKRNRRPGKRATSLLSHGEPMVWLTGGALAIALMMIVGLLLLVVWQGAGTFWPLRVLEIETLDGRRIAGVVPDEESYEPGPLAYDVLQPDPREANSEGGDYPAIFGKVLMNMIMSILV